MTVVDIKSGAKEEWHKYQLALYCAAKPNPLIQFEEDHHRYFYNDHELPSVTTILKGEQSKFYAKGSAARGHRVHKACALDGQGILDPSSIGEEIVGYLAAWRDFKAELVGCFIGFEEIVGDVELGYAGRRDISLRLKADSTPNAMSGGLLYLKKTGKYVFEFYDYDKIPPIIAQARRMVIDYKEKRRTSLWG